MSHNNLKKANKFAFRGNVEAAITILLKDFEKKEAPAAAALAQIAAFQWRWEDVICYTVFALKKGSTLNTLNVYDYMVKLLALAALQTDEWERIGTLLRPILEAALKKKVKFDYNPHKSYLEELFTFINQRGNAPFVWNAEDRQWKPEEERILKFKEAVKTLPERDPKTYQNKKSRIYKVCSLAQVYYYPQGALDLYDQEVLPNGEKMEFDFDDTLFLASAMASVGRQEEAWKFIRANVYSYWPPDYAQVAPVELFFDRHLRPLLTPERCEEILKIAKCEEAKKLAEGKLEEEVDGDEDIDKELVLKKNFEAFGKQKVKIIFYSTQDKIGELQKKNLESFLQKQTVLAPEIYQKIFDFYEEAYPDYKEGFLSEGPNEEELKESLPSPTNAQALKPFLKLVELHMPPEKTSKEARLGLVFNCTWDEEHGIGIVLKNWKVIEAGHAQVAYQFT